MKPALRRLLRDEHTMQYGVHPGRAIMLTGLTRAVRRWLDKLDGTRDLDRILSEAAAAGLDEATARDCLDQLIARGIVHDAAGPPTPLHDLTLAERDRLAPDLDALDLTSPLPDRGIGALVRRRAARVRVYGAGRVGAQVATLLAAAGIGDIRVIDPGPVRPGDITPGGLSWAELGMSRQDGTVAVINRLTSGGAPIPPPASVPSPSPDQHRTGTPPPQPRAAREARPSSGGARPSRTPASGPQMSPRSPSSAASRSPSATIATTARIRSTPIDQSPEERTAPHRPERNPPQGQGQEPARGQRQGQAPVQRQPPTSTEKQLPTQRQSPTPTQRQPSTSTSAQKRQTPMSAPRQQPPASAQRQQPASPGQGQGQQAASPSPSHGQPSHGQPSHGQQAAASPSVSPGAEPCTPSVNAVSGAPYLGDGTHRPDLVILTPVGPLDGILVNELTALKIPHLLAAAFEGHGSVGPLVLPGETACLHCLDLTRRDHDPGWPIVTARLGGYPPGEIACDSTLATLVAAAVTGHALAQIDGRPSIVTNGTVDVMPDWGWKRRSWSMHPQCRCMRNNPYSLTMVMSPTCD
ncbi:hypothetical protein HII36_39235 [Nonomuraea sp. NN258]|uniref:ThiF family adenylyltransferase n=1 Tax=Nonomuraea antri TaxID=2730852 RepID=UPI0015680C0B|nr:hypothetical protein [Nonomuraea antri]NRQ37821.1 hypothetical protein [Nonomuraea antri]